MKHNNVTVCVEQGGVGRFGTKYKWGTPQAYVRLISGNFLPSNRFRSRRHTNSISVPIKRTRKDDAASWPAERGAGAGAGARPRNLLQIRFTPSVAGGGWWWGKKSHHVSSWLVLAAPPCECLIFGHKCCPRRVANFKIEFTIWIELLTDLAGLCFRPYSVSTQSETTKDCQTLLYKHM